MNKLISYFRQSLTKRLSFWIILFSVIIFLMTFGFMFKNSREAVREEAFNRANQILDNTVLRVTNILSRVEVASKMTEWLVYRHPETPDSMFVYSESMLKNYPELFSSSIAFEPNYFRKYGLYFSAYSLRTNDSIITRQGGSDEYKYFYMEWYLLPKLLDRPCWTEPYVDLDTNTGITEMLVSYCRPLKNKENQFVGTICTNVKLNWLSNTISAVKPYPNSYSIMVGKGGTFFVHPDSTKLLNKTIFTETLEKPDTAMTALGHSMIQGERGSKRMKIDGKNCYVFYSPIASTGWSMAIVCPEKDIFAGYIDLYRVVVFISVIGLLLMLYFISRIINKELKPLYRLAKQAESIASGQFDKEIPPTKNNDEIGMLTRSFANMKQSLVKYIDQLTFTTARKERIESELHIARDIQMSMVPTQFPPPDNSYGIDIYARMIPAREVGGDLYDYFILNDKMFFCLGDVSGKGVPASLFMAVTRNLFRIVAQQELDPARIAKHINSSVSHENTNCMFVTLFIGIIDLKTGSMNFCNCGHNPPIIDGQFLEMKPNYPLGFGEEFVFEEETISDIRGKQIIIYTDGLNEAENNAHETLGDERVIELVADTAGLSSQAIIDMLCKAVDDYRDGAEPNDDLTLMCIQLAKNES